MSSHGALTPHIMFSHSEKYIPEQRGHWKHTDRQDRASTLGKKQSLIIQMLTFCKKFNESL